jgi:hypothetical protein
MLQRRAVLAAISSVLATAVVPINALASDRRTRRDRLAGLLGQTFRLADENGKVIQAQLVALDDGPRCSGLEQFSIVIEGDGLVDGIHEVHHRDIGRLHISLVHSETIAMGRTRKRAFFCTFT